MFIKKFKEFKIMSVNSLKRTRFEDDEEPQSVEFKDNSIQLLKKNMRIPSQIKLVGVLTDKSFDIVKKSAKEGEMPMIRILFSTNVDYSIVRHSTTGIILRDKVADPNDQDVYYVNHLELTMENNYARDLFALSF